MVHKFLEHGAVKIESGEGEKVYKRTTISITKAKKVEDEKTWVQRVKILRDNITETGKEWVTDKIYKTLKKVVLEGQVAHASRDTGEAAMLQEFNDNTKIMIQGNVVAERRKTICNSKGQAITGAVEGAVLIIRLSTLNKCPHMLRSIHGFKD